MQKPWRERNGNIHEGKIGRRVNDWFFWAIEETGFKTFSNLQKVVKVGVKDRMVSLKIHRDLFGQMVIIMQHCNVDLKEVFKYPLGPLPWSLSGVVGELCKTNKVAILHHLEKDTTPLSHTSHNHAAIIDGMAAIQKAKGNGLTSQQFGDDLLQFIISGSWLARRIDIVFDVYRDSSIKNAERVRRSTGKLEFSSIIPIQKIQQWHSLLSSGTNKTSLVAFLKEEWKKETYKPYFEGRQIFLTCGEVCSYYNGFRWENVNDLVSNQEEADTRLLLHSHHASRNGFDDIMIHTPDTDVFFLMLSMSNEIAGKLYMKTGTRGKIRMIRIIYIENRTEHWLRTGSAAWLARIHRLRYS